MRIACGGCRSPKNNTSNKLDVDAIKNSPIEIDGNLPEDVYVEEFDADKELCNHCDASC